MVNFKCAFQTLVSLLIHLFLKHKQMHSSIQTDSGGPVWLPMAEVHFLYSVKFTVPTVPLAPPRDSSENLHLTHREQWYRI